MNILHINSNVNVGGAAVAANRLHHGLLQQGINSQFLFKNGEIINDTFIKYPHNFKLLNKLENKYKKYLLSKYPNRTQTLFSIDNHYGNVSSFINALDIDIVHLHWINNFLSVEDIAKINKPIVWSLHDMNTFTGGCHYDEECEGYKSNCSDCKVLNTNKQCDRSRNSLLKKESLWLPKEIIVNGLSKWIAGCAKSSRLFLNSKVVNIPNPIDLELINVIDKLEARTQLNLPKDKKIILFGAWEVSDPRKGYNHLKNALSKLKIRREKFILLVLGMLDNNDLEKYFDVISLGFISDSQKMNLIYTAADLFVSPSKQENLSNMIMESLAYGTPVVAFNIGGNGDMITHKNNGYLAKSYEDESMAEGIDWIFEEEERHKQLSSNARQSVLLKFDNKIIIPQYIELYTGILNK